MKRTNEHLKSLLFINAILSNPMTHVRNTAGNWITQGILMQERKIAGKFFSDASQTGGVAEFEAIAKEMKPYL